MLHKINLEFYSIILLIVSAIIPQITIFYAYINFSLNYISIILSIFILLFLTKSNYRFNFNYFFRLFLFLISAGILYIYESNGGLIIILSLLILIILVLNKFDNFIIYTLIKRIFIIFSTISFISYILYLFKFTSPFPFYLNGRGIMYLHLFTLSDFDEFNIFNPNSWRFYGFFNEPGALAAMSGIFIVSENFKFKKNMILYLFILCSFSTGIFVGLFFSYLYINYKKFLNLYFILLFLGLLLFYIFGKNSPFLFLSYFHEKLFYFTYDFFDFEEDRLRYSFLNYLFGNPFYFFLYLSLFFFIPSRFIALFILMGLYRHHFILNSIPILILIFFPFFYLSKKSFKKQLT
jgi:hypothetical protein